MSLKPTAPQLAALRVAAGHKLGLYEIQGTRGLRHASLERMAKRMVEAGWMDPYVHGGYEITEAGRAVLKHAES